MSLEIKKDHPLAPYTTLKIGGPAAYFCEPAGIEEFIEALTFAKTHELELVWIGGGSNLLIHDRGFPGMVVRFGRQFSKIELQKDCVIAEAGCWLPSLMKFGCDKGVLDLSFCAGIPGTVGGAVYMNAGTHKGTVSDRIEWVELMNPETLERERWSKAEMDFGYRRSVLQQRGLVVICVGFRRTDGDGKQWWKEIREQVQWRKNRQPRGVRSAGCFFQNPREDSAGALIDEAGLKGTRVGDAVVSAVHANFLVNAGNATADDFLNLVRTVRRRVLEEFGIFLDLEVRLLGFPNEEI